MKRLGLVAKANPTPAATSTLGPRILATFCRFCWAWASMLSTQIAVAQQYQSPVQFTRPLELNESASNTPEPVVGEPLDDTLDVSQSDKLGLSDVVASVYRFYPEVLAAQQESTRAGGELTAAYGAFDTKLYGETLSEPTGFYRNYRNGIGVARQTWWGGYLSAGYRVGRGSFQPWYKERQTNSGGEFKISWYQPLLQGRAIDANRVAVFQAAIDRRTAEPQVLQSILGASSQAAMLYWDWVASGAALNAQTELLSIAETRQRQFEAGVKAGQLAEIDLILNQQLVAERKGKAFEAEQKFRNSSFKLSVFLRDGAGEKLVPADEWLPAHFPNLPLPEFGELQNDIARALLSRPEPTLLALEIQSIQQERRLASNYTLPSVDVLAEASQDLGIPSSSLNDKGQFELLLGLQASVPVQRRKARGKIQSSSAKIVQLTEKLRLQRDKIGVEVQTARTALQFAEKVKQQAQASQLAANETLTRYRFAFERGKIDLIYLNLLEVKAYETQIKLIDTRRDWFSALVQLQSALGLDPLEQSLSIDAAPASEDPSTLPGNINEQSMERDWRLHAPAQSVQ
ncbi:MAG: TolC family protein [Planctomycetales bacterium]|nr:TolC family protein [Planctomycetales bacterium]